MSQKSKKIKEEKDAGTKIGTVIKFGAGLLAGFLIAFLTPLAQDFYNITFGKYFKREAIVKLEKTSNTSLKRLNSYSTDKYYEITSFRISNIGSETTQKDNKVRIGARGEILGITPKQLEGKLVIDKNDSKIATLDIGSLKPSNKIEGEIHSLSNVARSRNEISLIFDKIGEYKLLEYPY